ncbi:ImmA/IrrE family metallo-endopeptidase [Aestuariivirga sp.]|uniref:ImmA/IrrE family metallo-endopeptidase n=1 Tax=Aestuariivirga sp. TaxID=2650926 RepID=UPI0035B1F5B9
MSNSGRKSPRKAANDLTVLLRTVLGEDRFPVDVEALALEISRNYEDPITAVKGVDIDGFEGMLRARRKKPGWQILYNTEPRYRGRERFTLAHEFGHYLLHRRPLTAAHYRNGELSDDFDFECLPLQSNDWKEAEREREEEADTFASFLLMPIDDYRSQVGDQEITRDLLGHITDRYGVSLLAATRKWIEFTDTRSAMVVARDGFALWGRASTSALDGGVFIRSGMPIPDGSVMAMGSASQHANSARPVSLPDGVWTFSRGSEPVRELAFFSDRLGISVSLLQFDGCGGGANIEEEEPWDSYDQFTRQPPR